MKLYLFLMNLIFLFFVPLHSTPSFREKELKELYYFDIKVVEEIFNKYGVDVGDKKGYQIYSLLDIDECMVTVEAITKNDTKEIYNVDFCNRSN